MRILALLLLAIATPAAAQQQLMLASPDGTIQVTASAEGGALRYAVSRGGETIIAPSQLRLRVRGADPWSVTSVAEAGRRSVDERWSPIATKTSAARDQFNELVLTASGSGAAEGATFVIRAYDDGIAFRYRLAAGAAPVEVEDEETEFLFPANLQCRGLNIGRFQSSHEGEFDPVPSVLIREHHMFDMPFGCTSASGRTAFVIAEADLADYGGLYVTGQGSGRPGMRSQIARRLDDTALIALLPAGKALQTPWRVVMLADHPGRLIESMLIQNLSPPSRIADPSWIKPGLVAWDWWSGPYLPPPAKGGTDMETIKAYIDFAAKAGLPYMLIDEGWNLNSGVGGSAPENADVTRTQPWLDMPELVRYAAERKVGLLLWAQWQLLDRQMDAALAQYQAWGIKGIKVDFMNRNDQQMVDYYHSLMEKAAAHRLLVNMHGAYPPTGLNRTWPNYLTQEGVLGAEYNKWSHRITAEHNVTLPYTRMLLGPMDYTPGGFRNRTPAEFQPVNSPPLVQTSRGQALAMYVVYDSPLQTVADSPDTYRNAGGFDFIRSVPTTWDETRFVAGEVGEYIVVARRKGRDWYLGAMTDGNARDVSVPLSFLGAGSFSAELWSDGAKTDDVRRGLSVVTPDLSLPLVLAANGGAAAVFRPRR